MTKNIESSTFPVEGKREKEPVIKLFHVSGFEELADKSIGDNIFLTPGPHGAEGKGVYFSENVPRFEAAEGAQNHVAAVIVIEADSTSGWWRSKGYVVRKFGRPRTWHSDEKEIALTVSRVEEIDGIKYLYCDWEWVKKIKD